MSAHPETTTFRGLLRFLADQMKPRGPWLTVFNVLSLAILGTAAVLLFFRFRDGLGAVSNLDQEFPWGLWKGFNVVTGVAFAGGAYVLCFLVTILRLQHYEPIVRITVLNGFLAYAFYAGALLLDLGRPWNVVNPIIGNDFGLSSVLFLVAWHFLLYMAAQFFEFSPAIAEWIGWERVRKWLAGLTVGAVVFGITLSTLHQSGLGALYLMAKDKIHPLWYSEFLPVLFFVSSIFAGLSMVVFEGSISKRVFRDRCGPVLEAQRDRITFSLARIAGGAMFVYLFLQVLTILHGQRWAWLGDGWGAWYLLEVVGFVAFPMWLFLSGSARRRLWVVRTAAGIAMLGIVLNRMNVSVIAFRWDASPHYVPSWQEFVVAAAVICAQIWVLRWVVLRMPVLGPRTSAATASSKPVPSSLGEATV